MNTKVIYFSQRKFSNPGKRKKDKADLPKLSKLAIQANKWYINKITIFIDTQNRSLTKNVQEI